jgi:hypothetical protein
LVGGKKGVYRIEGMGVGGEVKLISRVEERENNDARDKNNAFWI